MNKVLLTGASGFIGQHFLQYLIRKQYQVRALLHKNALSLTDSIETFHADITNADSLRGACEGINTIFHLAGFAHAEENQVHAEYHHQINYLGTKHLIDEAKRAHVKCFIYFSSVKAEEAATTKNLSPYAKAKYAAEKYVLSHSNCMHVCVLRPSLVYGPGLKGNLAAMLTAIDKKRFPPLPETHNRRSMVSVNDLCHAALLASMQTIANGKTYTVTDGVDYSTRQLYELMCKALGRDYSRFHIPLKAFKVLAHAGDLAGKITKKHLPFNSETFDKLFGSQQYSSKALQSDLGFIAVDRLEKVLPAIVAHYRMIGQQTNDKKY